MYKETASVDFYLPSNKTKFLAALGIPAYSLTTCNAAPTVRSKMAPRGPQNG